MRRGSSLALFTVGLWLAPVWADDSVNFPPPRDPSAEATTAALKKEAYFHFFLEDYLTAATRLKLLEAAVPADPATLNHVKLLRGSLYMVWGMHRPATEIFDQLVTAFPPGYDRDQVLLLIERLQYSRALYAAAASTYDRLTRDPDFSSIDQAAYLAGMSYYALGNFEKTLSVFTTIPASSPYIPFAELTAAKAHNQLADVEVAVDLLSDVGSRKAPDDPIAEALSEKSRLTLGLLLTETGRYDEALPVFVSVPPASPFFPDALFGRGWAHLYREEYTEALAAFVTLLRVAPNHPYALEALTTVGHCYERMGARGEAFQAYGTALDTYRRERRSLDAMRAIIDHTDRLAALMSDFTAVLDSPLGSLLEDDGLRYWVKQYSEVGALDTYLARRLDDMAVFDVMVNHREAVFRDRLPVVRQFLLESPAAPLNRRRHDLQATLDQATQRETAEAWASGREGLVLGELTNARRQSESIGHEFAQMDSRKAASLVQYEDLKAQWRNADRWLGVLRGEQAWTILTEIPGRRDDLQREMTKIESELAKADRNQRALTASIGGLERDIVDFRRRILAIRQDAVAQRKQLSDLRAQLLPPLQALLSDAVNRRSSEMEAMAAVAQLSQVHIMDVLTQ